MRERKPCFHGVAGAVRLDRWVPRVDRRLNQLLARVLLPASIPVAAFAEANHHGALNLLQIKPWRIVGLLPDRIYGQHVMFHYVPLFWRFHMMHHTDTMSRP